ncbi:uncharacterized protein BCR38DRAFT_488399 [Pseudomassariella vexata]|uniref:Uncharacterized protein n=1 Tax=Pseudomassariella vexata TaxID=1141098 RepID=A0A1Y2DLT3_9PEZI|nr:uncharacterized protein BCR38DRAFT_488399 [Pseudomassariella vexata]ORY60217.1 hypothetical protein BCR38DRAFT_488399 [Pseudomassariella vexata]
MQPYQGAKQDGAVGFLKSLGRGLGGVIFKPAPGAYGIPGCVFMGIYEEMQEALIVVACLARGGDGVMLLGEETVQEMTRNWQSV